MQTHFIEQVRLLMEIHCTNCMEIHVIKPNNYMWLCSRKPSEMIKHCIPIKDELKIRQCLNKITHNQEIIILKKLSMRLKSNPAISPNQIPAMTLTYLNDIITENVFQQVLNSQHSVFSRITRIKNNVRKFKLIFNINNRSRLPIITDGQHKPDSRDNTE